METLTLYFQGTRVSEHVLGTRPLAVGRAGCCDIAIADSEIAAHQWLFVARHGTVFGYDLARRAARTGDAANSNKPSKSGRWVLPIDRDLVIGGGYSLRRNGTERYAHANRVCEPRTESLAMVGDQAHVSFGLRIGRGAEARRVRVDDKPIQIGTAAHNDIVLWDRAVSAEHCRIEPAERGLYLRDLSSRNGTHVQGIGVSQCELRPGAGVRIGRTELFVLQEASPRTATAQTMVAASDAMQQVMSDVQRWSPLSWPVLVLGESGVGKEGVARALHDQGPRAKLPFVALNAGGLPRELIESELFGHERGAFTGATIGHRGVFEQAHRGTLFLDEIGELPLELQARLLRVLETGELRRVGAETSTTVDVRLVCATHRNLHAMVAAGTFRRDLYYRIARLLIDVPPLRERADDIEPLAVHFLAQIAPEVGQRVLTEQAKARVLHHAWPGNARELRNVLSTAAVATSSAQIDCVDIELALRRIGGPNAQHAVSLTTLQSTIAAHGGNLAAAARVLGIARSTLRDRLRAGV